MFASIGLILPPCGVPLFVTAIAVAGNPVEMALAFKAATEAGRRAYEAGLGMQADNFVAEASSPLTAFLNE